MSYKIVILKTKTQALNQAEQFLRHRQWEITTATNLHDAVAAVIQKQPEFILISADHPNRKARALPKLISQAFPVKVVGFVEASTNASMALLHEMGLEYNVLPPVSGPAIERVILRIKKDEEKKELDRQRAIENGSLKPEQNAPTSLMSSEDSSSAREILARLLNDGEDEGADLFVRGAAIPDAASGENDDPASAVAAEGSGDNPDPADEDGEAHETPGGRARKRAPIMEHGPIGPRKNRKQPTYKRDPAHYPDRDSIIVKGTQAALDESVIAGESSGYTEIQSATNIACITISSPRVSGYLVAALGADRRIDAELLKTVQERLFSFLRANGETLSGDDGMQLLLEQVDFEDWAISQANFLRKSVHGADEIAMAFFPSKETEIRLERSASETMLQLGIDELHDDVPVEFNLYIYLPNNKKYLLYTPQGHKLFGTQRGRLRDKGVTHMHLRKDSVEQVKRYRAQADLNAMIKHFKRGRGKKAG